MKIQQLIEEQMQIFEKGFQMGEAVVDHRWDAWKRGVLPSDIKSFMNSQTRKLIEALGEEIISEGERIYDNGAYGDDACEGDECHFESGYLVARDVVEGQQAKLKEIISSLK